jgi:mono/diheme cytochrome c family protein
MRFSWPNRRPIATIAIAATLAAIPLACGGTDEDTTTEGRSTPQPAEAEQPLSPSEQHGMEIFVAKCGSCHTLDAAGTQGAIGPNLDEAEVDEAGILEQIEHGGGSMPANLVSGQDAKDVAAFVAASGSGS